MQEFPTVHVPYFEYYLPGPFSNGNAGQQLHKMCKSQMFPRKSIPRERRRLSLDPAGGDAAYMYGDRHGARLSGGGGHCEKMGRENALAFQFHPLATVDE
jgi:hypothetical protein